MWLYSSQNKNAYNAHEPISIAENTSDTITEISRISQKIGLIISVTRPNAPTIPRVSPVTSLIFHSTLPRKT